MSETRRDFLSSAAALALAGRPAVSAETSLPTLQLGKYEMTRLVLGSNPFTGASHFNPILDALMKEWYTPERVLEVARHAEASGIKTWQTHNDPKLMECIRQYLAEGGKMKVFILCDFKDPLGSIKELAKLGVMGIVHHGEKSDIALREGKMDPIHDFLKATKDEGLMAGISMHNPAVIDFVEGKGWDADFYMTCVYRRSRTPEEQRKEFNEANVGEPYFEGDPARMCKMVRQTKKTCFAFKILAAGRALKGNGVTQAFKFVFENIKPQDGVIVGMFPKFSDQIAQNVQLAKRFGAKA
jgi:hypothetical protein